MFRLHGAVWPQAHCLSRCWLALRRKLNWSPRQFDPSSEILARFQSTLEQASNLQNDVRMRANFKQTPPPIARARLNGKQPAKRFVTKCQAKSKRGRTTTSTFSGNAAEGRAKP